MAAASPAPPSTNLPCPGLSSWRRPSLTCPGFPRTRSGMHMAAGTRPTGPPSGDHPQGSALSAPLGGVSGASRAPCPPPRPEIRTGRLASRPPAGTESKPRASTRGRSLGPPAWSAPCPAGRILQVRTGLPAQEGWSRSCRGAGSGVLPPIALKGRPCVLLTVHQAGPLLDTPPRGCPLRAMAELQS